MSAIGRLGVFFCVLVGVSPGVHGQVPEPGARMRVELASAPGQEREGVFQGLQGDDLLLSWAGGNEIHQVPREDISKIRVYRGQRRRAMRGLAIGAVSGAVAGGFIGLAGGDDHGFLAFTAGEKAAMGGIALGLLGAAAGLVAGSFIKTDDWALVGVESLQPSVRRGRGGGVELSLNLLLR